MTVQPDRLQGDRPGVVMTDERSAEARRRDIVAAARHEFANRGYDGARVDAIVARANVSKNLAYHYFSSKEGLFIAVMEDVYRTMMSYYSDDSVRGMAPVEGMEHIVRCVHRSFLKHPEVIPLLNSENLHRAGRIAKSSEIRNIRNPLAEAIADVLARGAADGCFRAGIDPVEVYISVAALCWFHLSNAWTLGALLREDLLLPDRLARREAHVVEMVLAYLTASGAARGAPG